MRTELSPPPPSNSSSETDAARTSRGLRGVEPPDPDAIIEQQVRELLGDVEPDFEADERDRCGDIEPNFEQEEREQRGDIEPAFLDEDSCSAERTPEEYARAPTPHAGEAPAGSRPSEPEQPAAEDHPRAAEEREPRPSPTPDSSAARPLLAPEALHGIAGDVVRIIGPHTESDPAALLLQFLVAAGNVIGDGPYYVVDGNRHHVNLYAALVGKTSKARKGTSLARVRSIIEPADPTWAREGIVSGLASGEGLIFHVRDPRPATRRGEVADPGVIDKRKLIIESEFAAVLRVARRKENILSEIIRQAWDHTNLQGLTKNNSVKATNPHISIIGHITRADLDARLDFAEIGNGFANRFLWAWTERSKILPDGGSLTAQELSSLSSRISGVIAVAKKLGCMRRDDTARSLWHAVYPQLSLEVPGVLGMVTSRAEAQVLRLSCIYALLDGTDEIAEEHLRAALAVWRYAEASCRFVFGTSRGNRAADTILDCLRAAPDGRTRTELHAILCNHASATQIDAALNDLKNAGLATCEELPTGGRPAQKWRAVTP